MSKLLLLGAIFLGLVGPAAASSGLTTATARRLAVRHESGRVHLVYNRKVGYKITGSAHLARCTLGARHRIALCRVIAGPYTWTDEVTKWGPCPSGVVTSPGHSRGGAVGPPRGCYNGPFVVLSYGMRPVG